LTVTSISQSPLSFKSPLAAEFAEPRPYKHIGPAERLALADQPSLSQVLAEITDWLAT
jgi:hypothetical protein